MGEGQDYEIKCQICGKNCDRISTFVHWKITGHNLWKILIKGQEPPKRKEKENGVPKNYSGNL